MKLKRELGLITTTLYGIGIILGAGVYALIGVGAGLAGNMLWLAFVISSIIAIFTGMSYAELAGRFPKEAAEYTYTKKAFNREIVSYLVGWLLVVGLVGAASAVALGFAGYFSNLFGTPIPLTAAALIVIMSLLNYIGIKESTFFNNFSSIVEAGGLILVVLIVFFFSTSGKDVDLFQMPSAGFEGIMAAVSVVFFAYIGFENVANLAEEVKNSKRTIPMALLLSLAISTILYILISIAAVKEVGADALAKAEAPLTLVVSKTLGEYSVLLSLIALFATANTVLILLITASRILYGMSHSKSLPKFFSFVGNTGTPVYSVCIVGLVAVLIAYSGGIKTVAQLTDLAIFIAYFAVNISLIALPTPKTKKQFITPRIFGIPILAYIGAITSLIMLTYFDFGLWAIEIAVAVVGIMFFWWHKNH